MENQNIEAPIFKTPGKIRFRTLSIVFGSLIVFLFMLATSAGAGIVELPFGAEFLVQFRGVLAAIWGVTILYLGRKTLFDYIDMGNLARKATESAVGAGLVFLGMCVTMLAIALIVMGMIATFS